MCRGRIVAPRRGDLPKPPPSFVLREAQAPLVAPVAPARRPIGWMKVSLVLTMFIVTAVFSMNRATPSASPIRSFTTERQVRLADLVAQYQHSLARLERARGTLADRAPGSQALAEVKRAFSGGSPARAAVSSAALEERVYRVLERYGKPVANGRELSKMIVREALAQEYDPVFVAAVIKSESAFNTFARSHKGALGLMQLMPKTGAWLASQANMTNVRLTDPQHNLKLGIAYLKQLEDSYGGNRVLTLVAYNWGPGRLESASGGRRRVPGAVMQYAVRILNDYRRWSGGLG